MANNEPEAALQHLGSVGECSGHNRLAGRNRFDQYAGRDLLARVVRQQDDVSAAHDAQQTFGVAVRVVKDHLIAQAALGCKVDEGLAV